MLNNCAYSVLLTKQWNKNHFSSVTWSEAFSVRLKKQLNTVGDMLLLLLTTRGGGGPISLSYLFDIQAWKTKMPSKRQFVFQRRTSIKSTSNKQKQQYSKSTAAAIINIPTAQENIRVHINYCKCATHPPFIHVITSSHQLNSACPKSMY